MVRREKKSQRPEKKEPWSMTFQTFCNFGAAYLSRSQHLSFYSVISKYARGVKMFIVSALSGDSFFLFGSLRMFTNKIKRRRKTTFKDSFQKKNKLLCHVNLYDLRAIL